jgi:flagellar hook assembly protein FlgD
MSKAKATVLLIFCFWALPGPARAYDLTLPDASGDDYGPGTYVYPYDPVFTPGSFDITNFRVWDQGNDVRFEIEIAGEIEDPWGSGGGFSLQSIDIYIDQDGVPGSGATWSLERRNVSFSASAAWEYVVWCAPPFEGFETQVIDQYGTAYTSGISVDVDQGADAITVIVPRSILGAPDYGWRYLVLMLGQNGYEEGRVRPVKQYADQWALGGGHDGQADANVIDIVAESGVNQEALLSNYNPLTFVSPILINRVDTAPPVISYSPPASWEAHIPLMVGAVITDDVVLDAGIFYRRPGDTYTHLPMVRTSETAWMAQIPGSAIDETGLEYYIEATDGLNAGELPVPPPFALNVTPDITPPGFAYLGASPNPFYPDGDGYRDSTAVTAALTEPGYVHISVLDSMGFHVRTLMDSIFTEGAREVFWDGRDDSGQPVGEGRYAVLARATDLAGHSSGPESTFVEIDSGSAMRQLDVILLFHANQNLVPYGRVGNIACYEGVLQVLRDHPSLKFPLHFSGCLLSDLMWSDPHTVDLLRAGVAEGQFEIVGSTYAQNIMYSTRLADNDFQFNQVQISTHKRQIEEVIGASPVSFWNPERVWTQNLVKLLADNDYQNVQIEDHILWDSGITGSEYAIRTTTYGGNKVNVFTDDKSFEGYVNGSVDSGDTSSIMSFLRSLYDEDVDDRFAVCYFEDMEATGLWDYEGGNDPAWNWDNLDKLLTAFENDPRIKVTTYTEWLENHEIYEDITPVVDGAADWMGRDAWFLENAEPLAESYRLFWDGIRDTLNAIHSTFPAYAPDTASARALLDHAWFTLIAHQYEFAVHGYAGIAGTTQWELARLALVSARAAREALARRQASYEDDVNDDGIDETVLVTPNDYFVFSPYGGRLLYWFDLEYGREFVGNENFMRSYGEAYTNDNAYVTEAAGSEAYPWLAGNYIFPEVHEWTFEARRRCLNDFLGIGGTGYALTGAVMSHTLEPGYIQFTYGLPGVHISKRLEAGDHELSARYTFTSSSPSAQNIDLAIENGLSPDCLRVTLTGRDNLRYFDGSDTCWAFTPSTRGVSNVGSDCAVRFEFGDEPDLMTGDEDIFGLEVNPEWSFELPAFGVKTLDFKLKLTSTSDVKDPEPGEPRGLLILPNPALGEVKLRLSPSSSVETRISVFDLSGRLVRSFTVEASSGPDWVTWDGCNRAGRRVAPGIYLVRATSGPTTEYGKVALFR